MFRFFSVLCLSVVVALTTPAAAARTDKAAHKSKSGDKKGKKTALAAGAATVVGAAALSAAASPPPPTTRDGEAEARLIQIYKLIGQGKTREALSLAQALVQAHPNFQLAQMVYGDLLNARRLPLRAVGDVPESAARAAPAVLAELREESLARLQAVRERPPAGTVPSQFLNLSPNNRHAIAVDTSRSRLYLFENQGTGLRLLADYYISVGKLGVDKLAEGDQRTPLGVYFITSNLDPKQLKDFYGAGALPINYPNPLDVRRGKTGSGIWLHGTPPDQFARAPKASDGCIVLANPDLERVIRTVAVRSTPVVIAQQLQWVAPQSLGTDRQGIESALELWRSTKSTGRLDQLAQFYSPDFKSSGRSRDEWLQRMEKEIDRQKGRPVQLKDLSVLRWKDNADTMVVTFGEVTEGAQTGRTRRQYWERQGSQWKIFYEGVL